MYRKTVVVVKGNDSNLWWSSPTIVFTNNHTIVVFREIADTTNPGSHIKTQNNNEF